MSKTKVFSEELITESKPTNKDFPTRVVIQNKKQSHDNNEMLLLEDVRQESNPNLKLYSTSIKRNLERRESKLSNFCD